jgi:hypothetical protein
MALGNPTALSRKIKDERGKPYGKLTVIELHSIRQEAIWLCRCDCGNTTTVAGSDLRTGGTKSCGCGRKTQGGGYKAPEYATWKMMKARCYNTNNAEYHNYGARGIVVCDRWRRSFVNFLSDMGARPFAGASIDRFPNNDGNYEPGNCRWATPLEQGQNTRKVVNLTYDGKTQCIRAWARDLNIQHCVIRARLKRGLPLHLVLIGKTSHQ